MPTLVSCNASGSSSDGVSGNESEDDFDYVYELDKQNEDWGSTHGACWSEFQDILRFWCGAVLRFKNFLRTAPNHSLLASTGSSAWIPDEDINDEDGPDGGSEEDDFAEMVMDEDYQDYIDDHEEYKKDIADEVRLQLTTGQPDLVYPILVRVSEPFLSVIVLG